MTNNIFTKPKFGWTHWGIKRHEIGPVSYLSDVIETVCRSCSDFLDGPEDAGFNISFDAEGFDTGIVKIERDFFSYDTALDRPPYINNLTLLSEEERGKDFVAWFLESAIADFEAGEKDWAWFNVAVDDEEIEENRKRNMELIQQAKDALTRYQQRERGK